MRQLTPKAICLQNDHSCQFIPERRARGRQSTEGEREREEDGNCGWIKEKLSEAFGEATIQSVGDTHGEIKSGRYSATLPDVMFCGNAKKSFFSIPLWPRAAFSLPLSTRTSHRPQLLPDVSYLRNSRYLSSEETGALVSQVRNAGTRYEGHVRACTTRSGSAVKWPH